MAWLRTPTQMQTARSIILVTASAKTWAWPTTSSRSPQLRKVQFKFSSSECLLIPWTWFFLYRFCSFIIYFPACRQIRPVGKVPGCGSAAQQRAVKTLLHPQVNTQHVWIPARSRVSEVFSASPASALVSPQLRYDRRLFRLCGAAREDQPAQVPVSLEHQRSHLHGLLWIQRDSWGGCYILGKVVRASADPAAHSQKKTKTSIITQEIGVADQVHWNWNTNTVTPEISWSETWTH